MKALFLLFGLSLCLQLNAQKDSVRNYTLAYTYAGGFILSHNPTLDGLANRHVSAHRLFFEHNTFGKRDWHQRYHFLKMGLMMSIYDLNNPEQLGSAYALSPYLKFNIFQTKHLKLRFRPSIGLGYIEKQFEVEENYKNIAIGSHVNMFISVAIESDLRLSKDLHWMTGISFDHLSNTGFQTPNLGINMPMISSGIAWDLGSENPVLRKPEEPYQRKSAYWQLTGGFGLNEINPPNEQKYLASALSITREKRYNYKSSLGYGLDFFYNPAQKVELEKTRGSISPGENLQVGASVLHLLHFGKLIFTSQLSVYLKSENKDLGSFYHVFGGRYPINRQLNVFFYGKTHISKAEYIIAGMGYRIGHE